MLPRIKLSNKWHQLGLWLAGIVVAFILLLIFTAPNHHPAPAAVAPASSNASPPAAPTPDPGKAQLILELFNPGDEALTRQLSRSALEQQIEHALTTSFVLRQCRLIGQNDYRDSFRALILYAQQSKLAADSASAETEVRRIAESSSASYALVYSRTRCDDPQLTPLADQLHRWTQLILTQ